MFFCPPATPPSLPDPWPHYCFFYLDIFLLSLNLFLSFSCTGTFWFFSQINYVLWRCKYCCVIFFLPLNSGQFNCFVGVRFPTLLKHLWQRPRFVNNCLHPVSFFLFPLPCLLLFPFFSLIIPFPCDLFLLYLLTLASICFPCLLHWSLW